MNDLWDLGLEPLPEQWLTGGAGELSGAADIGVDGNQNDHGVQPDDLLDEDRVGEAWEADGDFICAQCDDGGSLVTCSGEYCGRSFHLPEPDGPEGQCNPLGVSAEVTRAIQEMEMEGQDAGQAKEVKKLLCPSCFVGRQRCVCCGKFGREYRPGAALGDAGAPDIVMPCSYAAGCGIFWHASCIREWARRHPWFANRVTDADLDRHYFTCPRHVCSVCHDNRPTKDAAFDFVTCRRCPAAFHVACCGQAGVSLSITAAGDPKRLWLSFRKDLATDEELKWLEEQRRAMQEAPKGTVVYPVPDLRRPVPFVRDFPGDEHRIQLLQELPQNACYCRKHRMGEDLFTCVEPAVLWEEETLRKWQLDFATYKPNLQWSQGILVREKARAVRPAVPRLRTAREAEAEARAAEAQKGRESEEIQALIRDMEDSESEDEAQLLPKRAKPDGATRPPAVGPLRKGPVQVQDKAVKRPKPSPAMRPPKAPLLPKLPAKGLVKKPAKKALQPPFASHARPAAQPRPEPPNDGIAPRPDAAVGTRALAAAPPLPQEIDTCHSEAADAEVEAETSSELMGLMAEAGAKFSESAVHRMLDHPPPYDVRASDSIPEGQLNTLRRVVEKVEEKLKKRMNIDGPLRWADLEARPNLWDAIAKDLEREAGLDPFQFIKFQARRERQMNVGLMPFLHLERKSFTSFGRHFTKPDMLMKICHRVCKYLRPDDVVVDFSCGLNDWVPKMIEECGRRGVQVSGRSFDIVTTANAEPWFSVKSWFEVNEDDLRVHGDNMVVGLNPPFGSDTQNLASLFVLRAALFRPRLMILIVPPSTVVPAKGTWVNQPVKLGVVRDSYCVLEEDEKMLSGPVFYKPGSSLESTNRIPPHFRMLVRQDWYGHYAAQRREGRAANGRDPRR